jgi:hypothetical protein
MRARFGSAIRTHRGTSRTRTSTPRRGRARCRNWRRGRSTPPSRRRCRRRRTFSRDSRSRTQRRFRTTAARLERAPPTCSPARTRSSTGWGTASVGGSVGGAVGGAVVGSTDGDWARTDPPNHHKEDRRQTSEARRHDAAANGDEGTVGGRAEVSRTAGGQDKSGKEEERRRRHRGQGKTTTKKESTTLLRGPTRDTRQFCARVRRTGKRWNEGGQFGHKVMDFAFNEASRANPLIQTIYGKVQSRIDHLTSRNINPKFRGILDGVMGVNKCLPTSSVAPPANDPGDQRREQRTRRTANDPGDQRREQRTRRTGNSAGHEQRRKSRYIQ